MYEVLLHVSTNETCKVTETSLSFHLNSLTLLLKQYLFSIYPTLYLYEFSTESMFRSPVAKCFQSETPGSDYVASWLLSRTSELH